MSHYSGQGFQIGTTDCDAVEKTRWAGLGRESWGDSSEECRCGTALSALRVAGSWSLGVMRRTCKSTLVGSSRGNSLVALSLARTADKTRDSTELWHSSVPGCGIPRW